MKDFEYFAFISYSRKDEKWAKWLQNKLETYKLPSVIRQENSRLPERIYPIFRDKTDLSAGPVFDTLKKELEASQYLIVISTPESVKSEWVGKEIKAFIDMGRAEKIIPFIVEGIPNSGDENECFHPVLKNEIPEPLGINIHEIGKDQAFAKIAAKLLDLRFDSLWNRYKRTQRKHRVIAIAASILLIAGLVFLWNTLRIKKTYFADYVDKGGTPVGVVQLKKTEIKKRSAHYRFETSLGKLKRVVYANSAGVPIDHNHYEYSDRYSILVMDYGNNKRHDKTIFKDSHGKTMLVYDWMDSYTGINLFVSLV